MNKRIKYLVEQATTVVEGWSDENGTTRYYEFNKEKFAELIVRECSKLNNQFIGRRIGEIDLDMVYKEHFGVEV